MSIPLVQEATKDAINTSIIAIKRNIERINMLLGLNNNSEDIDTSEFVKKSDIVDEVTLDNMQSVTSNAVALAFKGMKVVECGKIYPDREAQDNWYIKYDCGLIEEWFLYSGVIPDMASAGNIFMSYKMIDFPIPLKSGTKALFFDAKVISYYGSTPNIWVGSSNDGTDSNTQQSVGWYSWYRNTNMRNTNVSFHLVGFWK